MRAGHEGVPLREGVLGIVIHSLRKLIIIGHSFMDLLNSDDSPFKFIEREVPEYNFLSYFFYGIRLV